MSPRQAPHQLLMIRPAAFAHNDQTLATNAFQARPDTDVQVKALLEFDEVIHQLAAHEIDVHVFADTTTAPDALFLNNWFSTHPTGEVVLYPMMAANRRKERRQDVVDWLSSQYQVSRVLDLSPHEKQEQFLEGTGSLVLDHISEVAYATISPRTSPGLVEEWCRTMRFTPVIFHAGDEQGQPIYHTNVVMWVGTSVAVLCLDAIPEEDQEAVISKLATTHRLVSISFQQMKAFAGNVLEVVSRKGDPYFLMSDTAMRSLLPGQIQELTRHADLLPVSIPTIEHVGGGGIRCMVAGNHLPLRQ